MRICIPLLSLGSYGGVRKILEIANYLSEKYEVWIIYPKGRGNTPFKISPKIKMLETPFKNRLLHLIYTANIINLEGFDIVIYNFFPTVYLALFSPKPSLYFVQDLEHRFFKNPFMKLLAYLTYLFPVKRITYNAAICKRTNCHCLIKAGVDKSVFLPGNEKRDKTKIMYIPRKEKRKGFDIFLDSLKMLKSWEIEFLVLLVGGTDKYDKTLKDLGINFEHVYPKDDYELVEYYRKVGVFVLTSRVEGLGFPVLEALSCGTPVVATRVDGAEVWGKFVVLCEKNPEDIARGIGEVLNDFEKYKAKALEAIKEIPTTFEMAIGFERCIFTVLDKKPFQE
ncbi:MAG: glycosyltransferase family 4 protein [candidate division WOR-3 bacterium]